MKPANSSGWEPIATSPNSLNGPHDAASGGTGHEAGSPIRSRMTYNRLRAGLNSWPSQIVGRDGPCASASRAAPLRPSVAPRLVDRELKVGQTREACLGIENAQARDDRALRKRRSGEARKSRRAHACQARARVDDLRVSSLSWSAASAAPPLCQLSARSRNIQMR